MPAAASVEAMNDHMAVMISLTMVSTHPQALQSLHPAQRLPAWVDNAQVVPCVPQALQLLTDFTPCTQPMDIYHIAKQIVFPVYINLPTKY